MCPYTHYTYDELEHVQEKKLWLFQICLHRRGPTLTGKKCPPLRAKPWPWEKILFWEGRNACRIMFPFVRMTKNKTVPRHVKLNHIHVFFYLTSSDLRILVSVTYKMALSFRISGTATHTMFSRNYKYWVRHVQGRPRYFCARQSNLTRAYNDCHFICIFKGTCFTAFNPFLPGNL